MPFFAQFPVLETERLILRQLRYEDGVDIYAYFTEELAKYYDWWPKTAAEGRGFVRFFKTDHFSRAELGYELSAAYQGQGIMSEVLRVIIPFGFRELEMHRIQASVFPANHVSIHLLEKFGFKQERLLREYTFVRHRDVWADCLVLALLRSEFEAGLDGVHSGNDGAPSSK